MKDKARLRDCHRLKRNKETGKLNSVYDSGLDPRPGKEIQA